MCIEAVQNIWWCEKKSLMFWKNIFSNFNADPIFSITKFHDSKWLNNFASFLCCVHLECTQERKTIKLLMQKLCDNLVQTVYRPSSPKYADIFAFQIVFFMLQSEFFFSTFSDSVHFCCVPKFHRNGNYVIREMVPVYRLAELSGTVYGAKVLLSVCFVYLCSFV